MRTRCVRETFGGLAMDFTNYNPLIRSVSLYEKIKDLNVHVDDAFISEEEGKKIFNIVLDSDEIIEYKVSGEELTVVDIPTGYTHSIINEGNTDMVTLMWCNECFNPDKPDTIYEAVVQEEK